MSYLYFPGCSLKGTGRAYEESMLSVFRRLDLPIIELDDWNCCGATAYMSISELKAFALSARNFAIAEAQSDSPGIADLIVPCAACYLGLSKAKRYLDEYPELRNKINMALDRAGLSYKNNVRIRHPLDVLANDVPTDKIKDALKNALSDIKAVCYYGCQIVRPYADFDDQHEPKVMDSLVKLTGAVPLDWPLKTRCCGGSLMGTVEDVGLRLSYIILKEAIRRKADIIVTACPLCQFNLECYQSKIRDIFGEKVNIPVVYFTQLMGISMGIPDRQLGLHRLFTPLTCLKPEESTSGGEYVRS